MAKTIEELEDVTRGTGNVFADLGYPDAMKRQARLRLAYLLNRELTKRKLTRAKATRSLGITRERVAELRHYRLSAFSFDRLITLLIALGHDIQIVIKRNRSRRAARIRVVEV